MSPIDDLAQAMNGRQITDDSGQVIEENETPQEDSPALAEETTANEGAQAEKPADLAEGSTQTPDANEEIDMVELASDETGKRYVPESRFKEVYGKGKAAERENQALKRRVQELESQGFTPKEAKQIAEKPLEPTAQLEIELLRATLPQFNPESDQYSPELDQMGWKNYQASRDEKGKYTITRLEAARQAVADAKKLQAKVLKVNEEARALKSQQSDQGITSRVSSHSASSDVPGENSSLEEQEAWLKAHGQW